MYVLDKPIASKSDNSDYHIQSNVFIFVFTDAVIARFEGTTPSQVRAVLRQTMRVMQKKIQESGVFKGDKN